MSLRERGDHVDYPQQRCSRCPQVVLAQMRLPERQGDASAIHEGCESTRGWQDAVHGVLVQEDERPVGIQESATGYPSFVTRNIYAVVRTIRMHQYG